MVERVIKLGDTRIEVWKDHVQTELKDGTVSTFWPPVEDDAFRDRAESFGYLDAMQYGIEHDICKSLLKFIAGNDNEALVDSFQYYVNTGCLQNDFLIEAFGARRLPNIAMRCIPLMRGLGPRTVRRA